VDELPDPAVAKARKRRMAKLGGAVALLLLGLVALSSPLSIVAFAGVVVLGWGTAFSMAGFFGLAMAIAFFVATPPRKSQPVDDLSPYIGPRGAAVAPAPPDVPR
jgi:hypothetical protein